MASRMHQSRRPRRRRKGQGKDIGGEASQSTGLGAGKGTPRYIPAPKPQAADLSSAAEHEARSIGQTGGAPGERPIATPLGKAAATMAAKDSAPGQPLGDETREAAARKLGADFAEVRIHTDSPLAAGIGANAVTYDSHIHFAPGAYRPRSAAGDALIGHELAHVVQQRRHPDAATAQFDIDETEELTNGTFRIEMEEKSTASGAHGEEGTIKFDPKEEAPYTAQLGLVQAISLAIATDTQPDDQEDHLGPPSRHVSDTTPADLDALHTDGTEGDDVDSGWRIDARTTGNTTGLDIHGNVGGGDAVQQGRGRDPFYQDSWHTPGRTQYGWVRGPGDTQSTILYDFPKTKGNRDFDFETAAVGADNAQVYGVLKWGFEVQDGAVRRPYARAVETQSSTFDAAMDKFRAHYAHEPIIVYFGTNSDTPVDAEQAKVDQAIAYLTANPDMDVTVEGFADHRGSEEYNEDLAARRRVNVEMQLEAAGVDTGRIAFVGGDRETDEFGDQGDKRSTAGNLKANRRVIMKFARSSP